MIAKFENQAWNQRFENMKSCIIFEKDDFQKVNLNFYIFSIESIPEDFCSLDN